MSSVLYVLRYELIKIISPFLFSITYLENSDKRASKTDFSRSLCIAMVIKHVLSRS